MRQIYFLPLVFCFVFPEIANACEPSPYSDNTLNRKDWVEIKKITKNNSMTINREPVTYYTISSIIGFPGRCSSSSDGRIEECIWIDGQDCQKKIKAMFRDQELSTIRKSGF